MTEVASGELEASSAEIYQVESCVASTSKSPRIQTENLDEIKTCLRREIMADLTKILAKNQKQMLELITPALRKNNIIQNLDNSASEAENIRSNTTSTPIKTKATTSENTPVNSRNSCCYTSTSLKQRGIRGRPNVAPYLRLKNSKRTSMCQVFSSTVRARGKK